jgi:quinol monooxygenase YgiN
MADGDVGDDLGDKPITILTRLQVEAGKLDRFDQLIAVYAEDVRTFEAGCAHYSVVRAAGDRSAVLIIGRYASLAAYRAHVEAPHTISALKILSELLDDHPVLEIYLD